MKLLKKIKSQIINENTPKIEADYNVAYQESIRQYAIDGSSKVLPLVFEMFEHNSILDVGCGTGEWLATATRLGAKEILGIDMEYTKATLAIPQDKFKVFDFNEPFDLHKKFDLVMTIEVAEHLLPESADHFVDSLVKHSDVVIFSAALPVHNEYHLNEQYWEYWIEKFDQKGYKVVDYVREKIWDEPLVAAAYKSDLLIFVNSKVQKYSNLPEKYPFKNIIHPELFGCMVKTYYKGKSW